MISKNMRSFQGYSFPQNWFFGLGSSQRPLACVGVKIWWNSEKNFLGALRESLARRLFHELACGVQFMHDNELVHRDIKCENLLITIDGMILNTLKFQIKLIPYYVNIFTLSLPFRNVEGCRLWIRQKIHKWRFEQDLLRFYGIHSSWSTKSQRRL